MAEIFGVIVGAVSVFGLFKNCVDCFECIQLGRNFGDDYERYKLRLGIAKFRLERWGVAIGINDDPRFRSLQPTQTDKEVRLIRSLLREIKHLFEDIHHNSRRYQTKGSENLEPVQELNPKHDIYKPSAKLPRPGYSRQWQTGFFKKTAWALYDKKRFEDIMVELSRLLDDLERILTSPNSCRGLMLRQSFGTLEKPSLSESKVVDSTDGTPGEPSKSGLKGDAVAANPADVLEQEDCGIEVTNDAGGMKVGEEARAHVGNVVKVQMAIQDRTVNKGGNAVVDGKARIQIGNVYGGKSIWED